MKLEQIWLLRWNQNIEEALQRVSQLQSQRGWPLRGAKDLLDVNRKEYPEYLDALLLKASLMRARSQTREASVLLAQIDRTHRELGHGPTFRLHFELGLDHWSSESVPQALDSFLLAEPMAPSKSAKVFTLSNMLWCLEALDLNRERIENKLNDLLIKAKTVEHVQEQFNAYLLRKAFYHGEGSASSQQSGQARYFTAWCASLPYMGVDASDESAHIENINREYLWQSSYRIRTLTATPLPTDIKPTRIGDAIDRLYLWVWQWLAGNPKISSEKIAFTLSSIAEQIDGEFLARENQLLLRNALAWLHLASPLSVEPLRKIRTELMRVSSSRYPLLEREFIYITQLEDPPDIYAFRNTVPQLPQISEILRSRHKLLSKNCYDIVVDNTRGQVECVRTGQTVESPVMARFFAQLLTTDSILLKKMTSRQRHNLVARVKRLCPQIKVTVVDDQVRVLSGRPRILLVNGAESADSVVQVEAAPRLHVAPQSKIGQQAARVLFKQGFTRVEIEKAFKTSKASACRWIQDWLDSGLLIKQGLGKGVRYQWKLS